MAALLVGAAGALLLAGPGRAGPQEPPAGAEEGSRDGDGLPPGMVARVAGVDIGTAEYAGFLRETLAESRLGELIDRLLIEQAARRAGVEVTPDDVAQRVEEEIDQTVSAVYQGDRSRYERACLEDLGMTAREHRAYLAQQAAYDLLLEGCVREAREVSEADVMQAFEREYGEGGMRYELQTIFLRRDDDGASGDAKPEASRGAARAAALRAELADGADFVALVRQHSEDEWTRGNDGRIPTYRPGQYGEAFDRAVERLSEQAPLSEVVETPAGFYILRLIRRTETDFDQKKAEIRARLEARRPDARETVAYRRYLRAKATIER